MANNRFSLTEQQNPRVSQTLHEEQPRRIDEILVELLDQYVARFPGIHITIMDGPSSAAF